MYYLKCNECGRYNEIFNESQDYCLVCTARIENSYQNWLQENPKGNFEEYLKTQCVTQEAMKADVGEEPLYEVPVQKQGVRSFVWITAAVIVVIGALAYIALATPYLDKLAMLLP